MFLTKISGMGKITDPFEHEIQGEVQLEQLLNGKIVVKISSLNTPYANDFWKRNRNQLLILEGALENQCKFRCDSLTLTSISGAFGPIVLCCSAPYVCFVNKRISEYVDIEVSLTNFRCKLRKSIEFELNGFKCKLEKKSLPEKNQKLAHARNYHHPIVESTLRVNAVKVSEIEQLEKFIDDVILQLSIVSRGSCFITTICIIDGEEKLYHKMNTPELPYKYSSLENLIHDEHIPQFLNQTLTPLQNKSTDWKIVYICDYYFHSLSLSLLWPMSLGILTALESLKDSFYENNPDEEEYGRNRMAGKISTAQVTKMSGAVRDYVIEQICKQNEKLPSGKKIAISDAEKADFKAQIKGLIQRPSYKSQLVRMFEQLGVNFDLKNVEDIIRVRNRIIHTGYYDAEGFGWREIRNAIGLVEKALLCLLEYTGEFLPYNELVWLTPNEDAKEETLQKNHQ